MGNTKGRERKELRWDLCSWEEAEKEECILYQRSSLAGRKISWDRGGLLEPWRRAEQPVTGGSME